MENHSLRRAGHKVISSVPRSRPFFKCQWMEPGYLDKLDFIVTVKPLLRQASSTRWAIPWWRIRERSTSRSITYLGKEGSAGADPSVTGVRATFMIIASSE